MTNNFDEFDHHDEQGSSEEVPQASGVKANLVEAWRSRPLFKLLVLMTVVGAIVATSVSFFGGGSSSDVARISKPPELHEAPGGPVSPYMKQQTEMADTQRTKQAMQTGGSALPTPIGQSSDLGDLGGDTKKNDPLNELRAETDRLKQQLVQVQQKQAQPVQQVQPVLQQKPPEQFDDSLAQAMQKQMSQLMEGWVPHGVKQVEGVKEEIIKETAKAGAEQVAGSESASSVPVEPAKTIISAGTVSYAQLLTEANSDVPGAILAQIVSGPLTGAKAIGQFKVQNDYLILTFNLATLKGKDYQINALALNPDTTLGGMATEVDERYFARVVLPVAAGFIQGFGQAMATTDNTVVSTGTTTIASQGKQGVQQGVAQGFSTGAQTMGQFLQNQANQIKPLVRVAAGTPMGLFFVTSTMDKAPPQQPQQPSSYGYPYGAYGAGAQGYGGVNPTGAYPGTTVNGYGSAVAPAAQDNGAPYAGYTTSAATAPKPAAYGLSATGH